MNNFKAVGEVWGSIKPTKAKAKTGGRGVEIDQNLYLGAVDGNNTSGLSHFIPNTESRNKRSSTQIG